MSSVTVFRLNEEVHFEPARAWSVQAHYAFVYHEGGPFAAETGRLVIYLGPHRFFDGQGDRVEHLYRFSDGRVGVLDAPPDGCFTPVDDREITTLAAQVKTLRLRSGQALPELVAEKGLSLETISRLDPFTLIACPLCRGTEFTTVDLAGVRALHALHGHVPAAQISTISRPVRCAPETSFGSWKPIRSQLPRYHR